MESEEQESSHGSSLRTIASGQTGGQTGSPCVCRLSIVSDNLMPSVFLFATLDTKGREADFVRGTPDVVGRRRDPRRCRRSRHARGRGRCAARADLRAGGDDDRSGAEESRPWRGRDEGRRRRGKARARSVRARRGVGRPWPGRIGGNDDRDGGDAGAAARRAEGDGQHARVGHGAAVRRRQRHLHAQLGGRHPRHQPRQPGGALAGGPGDGRPGEAIPRPEPQRGRQTAGGRDDVRRDDRVRGARARDAGARGLRGPGLPRDRQRRTGHGVAHQ